MKELKGIGRINMGNNAAQQMIFYILVLRSSLYDVLYGGDA